ncbi:Transcription factor [Penicillium occitanis (nom. inval.)]|nr:Transcription factor [Penicillium occitanis (nom. inval.)]PCG93305.1 hypothetical protein PENOC_088400 [Penicillium occitanis (nom. inval.)]
MTLESSSIRRNSVANSSSSLHVPSTQHDFESVSPGSSGCSPDQLALAQVDYEGYYGAPVLQPQQNQDHDTQSPDPAIHQVNMEVLRLYNAFDLPSAAFQHSLLDNFITHVHPLMPIVDTKSLESRIGYLSPTALVKAVLLAGARTTDAQLPFSVEQYYTAIKVIVMSGYEKDPVTAMVVACLLGWYNQSSVYSVNIDSASAWLRFASNIAYQVGLHKEPKTKINTGYRRRLWWTLVARDCLVSAGQGRPRIFNLADCDVKPISTEDFGADEQYAKVFVAYVKVCLILGDLCESHRRGEVSTLQRDNVRNRLFWWLKELPEEMQYFRSSTHASFDNRFERQLFVIYFAAVSILYRSDLSGQMVHPVSLVASSFLVSLLEDFLARDEVQRLPTMFTFYAISAAVPQLVATRNANLKPVADTELAIISQFLLALSLRWPTSAGAQKLFETLRNSETAIEKPLVSFGTFSGHEQLLFDNFNLSACRHSSLLAAHDTHLSSTAEPTSFTREVHSLPTPHSETLPNIFRETDTDPDLPQTGSLPLEQQTISWDWPLDNLGDDITVEFSNAMGSWLFSQDLF